MRTKNIGIEKALEKILHFCGYQERNQQEVRKKLYSYGLHKEEVESLVSRMIEENYLNEERYAEAFAGGKFRINKWGRIKIRYELKQKQISDYCIKKGIASIDETDYKKTLQTLFAEKCKVLSSEENRLNRKQKMRFFLLQRGFEQDLVSDLVEQM